MTLRKHVLKYENMQKSMVDFLRKFENRGTKINRVNSILITKSINLPLFTLILYSAGVRCNRRRFSVLSQGLLQLHSWVSTKWIKSYFSSQILIYQESQVHPNIISSN